MPGGDCGRRRGEHNEEPVFSRRPRGRLFTIGFIREVSHFRHNTRNSLFLGEDLPSLVAVAGLLVDAGRGPTTELVSAAGRDGRVGGRQPYMSYTEHGTFQLQLEKFFVGTPFRSRPPEGVHWGAREEGWLRGCLCGGLPWGERSVGRKLRATGMWQGLGGRAGWWLPALYQYGTRALSLREWASVGTRVLLIQSCAFCCALSQHPAQPSQQSIFRLAQ